MTSIIMERSDLGSPSCSLFDNVLAEFIDDVYNDTVRFVERSAPLEKEFIEWIKKYNGVVQPSKTGYIFWQTQVDFENEEDATAFTLRFS